MSEPTTSGPPVLGYSGRLIEGSGPWREHVDALIAIPCAPQDLRRYFKDPGDAARYFGSAMTRRYQATDPEPCVLCGAAGASRRVRLTWVLRLNWAILRPVGEAHFPTQHRVCDGCADRGWRRLRTDRWWGGFLMMLTLIVAGVHLAVLYRWGEEAGMTGVALAMLTVLGSLLLIVVNISLSARMRQRWRERFPIHMPDGVRFMGVVGFSRRPE